MSPRKGIAGKTDVAARVREAHALRSAFLTACVKRGVWLVIFGVKGGVRRCVAAVTRALRA
jgi:hypothetical protein